MSSLEKKLCAAAMVFVVIYLGAVVLTLKARISPPESAARIESAEPRTEENPLVLPELLLPMAILLTLIVCFSVLHRRNRVVYARLDDESRAEDP
jgi:hypothetical protein